MKMSEKASLVILLFQMKSKRRVGKGCQAVPTWLNGEHAMLLPTLTTHGEPPLHPLLPRRAAQPGRGIRWALSERVARV